MSGPKRTTHGNLNHVYQPMAQPTNAKEKQTLLGKTHATNPPKGYDAVGEVFLPKTEICAESLNAVQKSDSTKAVDGSAENFPFINESFADIQLLLYRIPGFGELSLRQKQLCYFLSEAGLAGRDILWDQNCGYNLTVRRSLEAVLKEFKGDRSTQEFQELETYAKRVWVANGIHHHYSSDKFKPGFTQGFFEEVVRSIPAKSLPTRSGESVDKFLTRLRPVLFDPTVLAKRVNRDHGADPIRDSANNYYENLTKAEVEAYYAKIIDPNDPRPVSHGLNSRLVKQADGQIVEQVICSHGLYGAAVKKIVHWLKKAAEVADTEQQAASLTKLVEYYETGNLKAFDEFNALWLKDTESNVDVINGFIETYGDAIGRRGSFESLVSIRDVEGCERTKALSDNAQWFEDNLPTRDEHKRREVVGVSARAIVAVAEAGDMAPTTAIGVNLPNADWQRAEMGSKSVTIGNIIDAYNHASLSSGTVEEFAFTPEEVARSKEFGAQASTLEVDIHEGLGHASGRINAGVGSPDDTLKQYAATLEESRADLVALYYITDPKLIELGLLPSIESGKAAYDAFIRSGLMVQLARVEQGKNLEEDHMRNRQLIAKWAYEQGKDRGVIEKVVKDDKTYFVVRDYDALRELFGELLREVQRIKSEGDYEAGREMVETYGVPVDPDLHAEVLARYKKLGIRPYNAFIQPHLAPVMRQGTIVDVQIEHPQDFTAQMLGYAEKYSLLSHEPARDLD